MGVRAHLRHHFRRLVGADGLDRLQVMDRRRIDFIVSSPAFLLKAWLIALLYRGSKVLQRADFQPVIGQFRSAAYRRLRRFVTFSGKGAMLALGLGARASFRKGGRHA
jgi:hypothetical protein